MPRYCFVATLLTLLAWSGLVEGQVGAIPDSLRGLGPVRLTVVVHVRGIPEAMATGAYVRQIRAAVAARLAEHGVTVQEDARPTLSVTVTGETAVDDSISGPYALLVDVSLTQFVELASGRGTLGKTWERRRMTAIEGRQALLDRARDQVLDAVDEFSIHYRLMNP